MINLMGSDEPMRVGVILLHPDCVGHVLKVPILRESYVLHRQ